MLASPALAASEERLPEIGPAPDFALVSQDGARVALQDFRGKIVAVTFIYTSCPDICPLLTEMLAGVQDELGADFGPRVAFVSITVDPARDTPEVLKAYAQGVGANPAGWSFLTGEVAAVREVARRYGVVGPRRARGRDRPHAAHLAGRPAGRAARAVSRLPLRPRGVPPRPPRPRERALMRIGDRAAGIVARVPARVQTKLLVAFLAMVALLVLLGAVGLQVLERRQPADRGPDPAAAQDRGLPPGAARHHGPALRRRVGAPRPGRAGAARHAAPAHPVRLRPRPAAVRRPRRGRAARQGPAGLRPLHRDRDAGRGAGARRAASPRRGSCSWARPGPWPTGSSA